MASDDSSDLDDLIDSYVRAACRETGTPEPERERPSRPEPVFAEPVHRAPSPIPVSTIEAEAFQDGLEDATLPDAEAAIDELHGALSLATAPELPRVRFARASVPPIEIDDEITNVVHRLHS